MDILAISRIDDAMSALGIARKALWEAYLYASKRSSFGKKLIEHNLMLRDLLEMEADLVSALILVIYASKEFSASSDEIPPFGDSYNYARMLTHISKNTASWVSDKITRYCMEVNGGKGFLREFPMEKFHRDAIVTSIWEGTSNIQALDMLSLIMKKKTHIRLKEILEGIAEDLEDSAERDLCRKLIDETFRKVIAYTEADESQVYAKDILDALAMITMKIHLSAISSRTHSSYFSTLNEIFTARHFGNETSIFKNIRDKADMLNWMSH
jgi:acyl-CoA dehydrogenase